ncbi:MAG: pyridoxal phosphate-dependent aminotransferase [Proteobacteria bacterium]|nr:pyridoxal phosphate-dependent aminotransferase [Pseudomonadota bacterium]
MPSLSQHISALKPSATLELNAAARKIKSQGVKVWNFSVGEPDYPPPQGVVQEAIKSLQNDPVRYGSAGGGLELRQSVQQKLTRENKFTVELDQIVCGVGAKQVLYHLMHALLNPGDEVLAHVPCWTSYSQQIASAQGQLVPIPTFPQQGQNPYDPEYIDSFVTPKVKAIIICSPNNPTGGVLKPSEMMQLAAYLKSKDFWLISDEIYEYFNYSAPHQSVIDYAPELKNRFCHINGVSKSFAMTGWRVGYMAGPQPVAKLVKTLISHSSTCLPLFVEKAATWAINQGKGVMAKDIESLKDKRNLALRKLADIPGVKCLEPEGAFYLFLDIREYLVSSSCYDDNNSLALSLDLLHQHHITVLAGEAFGSPGFLRVSYACAPEDLETGLSRLRQFFLSGVS